MKKKRLVHHAPNELQLDANGRSKRLIWQIQEGSYICTGHDVDLEPPSSAAAELMTSAKRPLRCNHMMMQAFSFFNYSVLELKQLFGKLLRWLLLALMVGGLSGSASALFLITLDAATANREANHTLIYLLPLAGFVIGWVYHRYGAGVAGGNNLLINEYHQPQKRIPLRMAPMVLAGTLLTHWFGGSAGREGTAVQMGGSLADQLTRLRMLKPADRRHLLVMGMAGGFASVFGTPLAGAIFAIEVLRTGRVRFDSLLPALLSAVVADYVCTAWGVGHTHYAIGSVPAMKMSLLGYSLLASMLFGITAWLFSQSLHFFKQLFNRISYPPLRPVIGGIVLVVSFALTQNTRYLGLGIPVIVASFDQSVLPYDFILKLLFTTFTLGAAFKGGEVTPLFFIGATLGNALAWLLPLPIPLLAGMGFVAVFAGATKTPIASTLLGIELFGAEAGLFMAIACVTAHYFSGQQGIYKHPLVGKVRFQTKVAKKHERLVQDSENEHQSSSSTEAN